LGSDVCSVGVLAGREAVAFGDALVCAVAVWAPKRMALDSSNAVSATGFSPSGVWFIDPAPVRSMKTAGQA
jgi:hypothetical protein